jgi:hypothetical protein
MRSKANTHRIGIAIIFGIILLYMIPYFILSVGWFGDDGNIFNFALRNSRSSLTDIFLFRDDCMGRYRPLMQTLATVSLRYFSFDSILIRLLSYVAFVTTIVTLFALVRARTNNIWSPVIGAVFFALSPIKVQSLFRLGRPEIFVTAFCLLAIYSLHKALEAKARKDRKLIILWNIGSLILAIIAALWSEIGISVFVVMAIWILTSSRETSTHEHKYFQNDKLRMLAVPAVGITLYLLWYISINAPLSSGESDSRYSIQLGWNLVQNTLSSLIGLTSPVAPVTAARIFYGAANVFDWFYLFIGLASITTICVTLFRGVLDSNKPFGAAPVFLASAMFSLFPFIIVGHVSEVYLTQAAAFFWGGVGILVGNAIERGSRERRLILMCASCLLALVMLYSSVNAHFLLRKNSLIFRSLHDELINYRKTGIQRLMLIPYCPAFNFSQYYQPSDSILSFHSDDMPIVEWTRSSPNIKWGRVPDCLSTVPKQYPFPVLKVRQDGTLICVKKSDSVEQFK